MAAGKTKQETRSAMELDSQHMNRSEEAISALSWLPYPSTVVSMTSRNEMTTISNCSIPCMHVYNGMSMSPQSHHNNITTKWIISLTQDGIFLEMAVSFEEHAVMPNTAFAACLTNSASYNISSLMAPSHTTCLASTHQNAEWNHAIFHQCPHCNRKFQKTSFKQHEHRQTQSNGFWLQLSTQLPTIKLQEHQYSNCSLERPKLTVWIQDIFLLMNPQQVNALLDLFAHVTQGAIQVMLKNDAKLCKFSRVKVKVPYKKEECTMALSMNVFMMSPGPEIIGGMFKLRTFQVPKDAEEEGKLGYTTLKHVIWHKSFKKLLEIEQYSKTGLAVLTQWHSLMVAVANTLALFDRLHYGHGFWGKHVFGDLKVIVKALGQQIKANVKKYVAIFPHWQNLTHFNQVIHITFSDGIKLANISKKIFYAVINVLKKSITPEGLVGSDVQTKHMINMINNKILTFVQTLKDYIKCIMKSNIEGLQTDWSFLKVHLWKHVNGAACNYSTWPNESMHKLIQDEYEHCLNGRDIPAQVLWVDHQALATKLLRLHVDYLKESVSGESDPEADAVSENTSLDHIKLGAHAITTQILKDLEENGQPDMVFHQFHQRFFKSWISLPTDFTVKEYCYLLVNYKSTVTWNQCTDHLCCNPSFFDIGNMEFILAQPFTTRIRLAHTIDCNLRLKHVKTVPWAASIFIPLRSII
ncbi:hypothetical protein F5J12DRAFT_785111 [Pisolithus orientalis]|uniref:uncharacterized protein n=1 Tax=Pisolithus orientalis TaxID=936130 RepID=UPI002224173E|nr:uncharacterized protein F5J12DRAFT_785111 [Pisolithus orientalis]KAI5997649.1 hypothetical protein F5J12DRAFT_785111 [Pisolithus orientalis]